MPRTFHRDRLTWLAYIFLALYGYFLNVLGPITPFLKDELRLSYTVSSLHFTAFAAGILVVGLAGRWPIRRLGRWRSLWIGAAGLSLGALLLVAGKTPVITIGASFLMGVIGSLILAIVPSALADRHGELRAVALSEGNVVASTACAIAPLLFGWFAHTAGGWRLALALVTLMPIVLYLGLGKAASATAPSEPETTTQARLPLPPLFWIYWIALVLAVAAEFCMVFWSANYMETVLGALKADAAQAVSLFLAGMILGRLAASRLVQRYSPRNLIAASILVAGTGFMIYWRAASLPLGLVGLFVTGLGVAGLYPLILSLTLGAAGENTVQAGTRATLASGAAILTLPLVLGRMADVVGLRPAYGIVLLLLAGALLITQTAGRIAVGARASSLLPQSPTRRS